MNNLCATFENKLLIQTPIGVMYAEASDNYLLKLNFLTDSFELEESRFITSHPILNQLHLEINQYFNGERQQFTVPLAQSNSKFTREIIQALLEIPFGKTISYSKLAQQYGNINHTRAIANVNANNNLLLIVPCHRVIGINQNLTGYAAGLSRKEWLLQHELKYSSQPYQTTLF